MKEKGVRDHMIMKKRPIPLSIQMHEALSRRVRKDHPSRNQILKNLALHKKGLRGEKSIDYYLAYLPEKEYYILHDLNLIANNLSFQMDTLLLSPYFFLILEVKNYDGTVIFDHAFKQLIRIVDGVEVGYPYPITQVERHKSQLHLWLSQKGVRQIPIETLVVFGFSSTIIKATSHQDVLAQKIIHSENIPETVRKLKETYNKRLLSNDELHRLAKQLIRSNKPKLPNLLETYQIKKNDLIKGVYCPSCQAIPMQRRKKHWSCRHCGHTSIVAHLDSLKDYAFLWDTYITNEELRSFLQLPSASSAAYILNKMELPFTGKTKGRKYNLDGYFT